MLFITIIIFFTSCNGNPIQEHLQYLASKECMGRYPGTQGNENAAEYISENFKQYGLLPFKETYFTSSEITLRNIEKLLEVSLIYEDGTITRFENGKDFIQRLPQNCNLSLPITNKPNEEDCILLLKNINEKNINDMKQYEDLPFIKAFLLYDNSLLKKGTDIKQDEKQLGKPYFSICDNMYKLIDKNYGKVININSSYVDEKTIVNNVIGKVEGKKKDTVLIISAHFDHAGFIGNNIWNGAIDNASGVSSLLELAKGIDKDSKPECDILFCAFNGEEAQLVGSKDIYELIKNDYENIYNINLDFYRE